MSADDLESENDDFEESGPGEEDFGDQRDDSFGNQRGSDWQQHPLGGDDYARQLGEAGDRFRDWAELNLLDKATGGNGDLNFNQFRLPTSNGGELTLSNDFGKTSDLVGSLAKIVQGKWGDISDKGAEKVEFFLENVKESLTADPATYGAEKGMDALVQNLVNAALHAMGIQTTSEFVKEADERREFVEGWTRSHSGWWRSEPSHRDPSHRDWQRSDNVNVKDDGPKQKFP